MVSARRFFRRPVLLAAVVMVTLLSTACTARGGGQLPPGPGFTGRASFGFSFSCEDAGGPNPPIGQLRIQLSYADKGSNPLRSSFAIHGIADDIDPVVESALCIGQNPPPGGHELIFLGRYRVTSGSPSGLSSCPATETSPSCRFEVTVRDNDANSVPSRGDYFSIKLSNVPMSCEGSTLPEVAPCTTLPDVPDRTIPYVRSGVLSSGNITVD